MRFGKLTALTGVLIFSLVLIFGCSDDKSSGPSVTYGSLDDPEFVPVKAQIDDALDNLITDIVGGFDNLNAAPNDTVSIRAQLSPPVFVPGEPDPDVITMTYANGWYYVYASYTGDVYESISKDSVQYQINGDPVEELSVDVDYLHFIDNWSFIALDQNVTHTDFVGRNDFQFSNLDQTVATINGTTVNNVETVYINVDTTATNTFTFEFTVTDLQVPQVYGDWISGCPQSGSLDIDMTETYWWTNTITQGSGTVAWEVDVAFNSGSATVTATNGVTTWQYTCEVCTVPQ